LCEATRRRLAWAVRWRWQSEQERETFYPHAADGLMFAYEGLDEVVGQRVGFPARVERLSHQLGPVVRQVSETSVHSHLVTQAMEHCAPHDLIGLDEPVPQRRLCLLQPLGDLHSDVLMRRTNKREELRYPESSSHTAERWRRTSFCLAV
jgi:hypothetical protein